MGEDRTGDRSWVDSIADRFERAWNAGQRPRIEDYLGDFVEPRRSLLLEELLRVEGELRSAGNEIGRASCRERV